ncbi:uncharacterized protein LOC119664095, partial [Teleopsis dalmanni]
MDKEDVYDFLDIASIYDKTGRILEAEFLYQKIVPHLVDEYIYKKCKKDKTACYGPIRDSIERIGLIRHHINNLLLNRHLIVEFEIQNDDIIQGYGQLFGKYLQTNLKEMILEEPQLSKEHEIKNLFRFFKAVTLKCRQLSFVKICTKPAEQDADKQHELLQKLVYAFNDKRKVGMKIDFKPDLEKTKMILSNGYMITLSTGLHIFKKERLRTLSYVTPSLFAIKPKYNQL